ncbi:acyl-CoA dehydrogenase family protein [Vulgatibacter incomptus]|uniref:Cyclohex-1-ene-1-carbonyl-CoA dehydrogenase n=1 Tax=Vulgatibacter incomptus TaxID=1391653 RepID=A0A0K1PCK1_9BACT|nr:acyl-CoA dehydrogenase family protein [Vulgatibacter incomptus]AKU90849.1 Butyryl-CoA dehydrogenase [Vulgatibacter incomptus]
MDFELNELQIAIRDAARKYAQDKLAPGARERDREERFPKAEVAEMASLGLMGVNIPEAYGGAEAGTVAYSLAMTEIAAGDASAAVTMAVTNMCGELIVRAGNEDQRQRYVTRLTSGEYTAGAFALSEPQAGSDPGAMATFAEKKGDRWVLNGAKQWITSGAYAGVMVVWARTAKAPGAKGISCFLVEGGTKGLLVGKAEDKMGLRASNTVPLTFEDCEIPEENLLGVEGDGFKWAMVALDGGRIGIASQAIGIGRAAMDASIRYAHEREAFGKPIADFQAIRFKLSDMATELDAARLLALRAAWLKENGRPFTREASMAKLYASEAANRAVAEAVQIHGGYGYVDEFPVERHLRDARVTTIYEGTSEIQRVVIARELLRG